jgi:hypothetical protein
MGFNFLRGAFTSHSTMSTIDRMVAKRSASPRRAAANGRRVVVTGLGRAAGAVHDVAQVTARHVLRLAGITIKAAAHIDGEVRELLGDVRDVAVTELRAGRDDVVLPLGTGHVRLPGANSR